MGKAIPTARIRVAIDDVPRLILDLLLERLERATDIELVDARDASQGVDVVLTTARRHSSKRTALAKLALYPRAVVLLISQDGRHLERVYFRVQHDTLDEPATTDVVAAIRQVARCADDRLPALARHQEYRR